MIGSPASPGAGAAGGCAARACRAAALSVSAVDAAIAASVTMAGAPQRRIPTLDCAVVNRLIMLCPVEMPVPACLDQVSDQGFWMTKRRAHHSLPGTIFTFPWRFVSYT